MPRFFGQSDGKDASELRAKPSGVNYSVLPIILPHWKNPFPSDGVMILVNESINLPTIANKDILPICRAFFIKGITSVKRFDLFGSLRVDFGGITHHFTARHFCVNAFLNDLSVDQLSKYDCYQFVLRLHIFFNALGVFLGRKIDGLNIINQNHPLNGWFARPLEGVITGLPPAAGGIECLTTHYFFKQPLSCGCLFLLNYSCYP